MKPTRRTEFHAQGARGDLIYDWSRRDSRWFGMCAIVAAAACVFFLPLAMIRVTLDPLPIQESESAGVLLIPPSSDPLGWLDQMRAKGPFPSRFEPITWEPTRQMVDATLRSLRYEPQRDSKLRFLNFPKDAAIPSVPLVTQGERILPPVPLQEYPSVVTETVRTQPVLYPLTKTPEDLPVNRPSFEHEITTEMDSQVWRFLLQVAPNGRVIHTVAMVGHNAQGREQLVDWLEAHRFPEIQGQRNRWIAIAITFQNQQIDEPDHP